MNMNDFIKQCRLETYRGGTTTRKIVHVPTGESVIVNYKRTWSESQAHALEVLKKRIDWLCTMS